LHIHRRRDLVDRRVVAVEAIVEDQDVAGPRMSVRNPLRIVLLE